MGLGITASTILLQCLLLLPASALAQSVSAVPDETSRLILVRSTLVALDHANRTGNYGVLRDLGSPRFGAANTEARLAAIFSGLREEGVDIRAAAVSEIRFSSPPFVDKNNLLRLAGVVPISPQPVRFDLAFEIAGGEWRLFGIGVNPVKTSGPPD
jgi:hypothetical protein